MWPMSRGGSGGSGGSGGGGPTPGPGPVGAKFPRLVVVTLAVALVAFVVGVVVGSSMPSRSAVVTMVHGTEAVQRANELKRESELASTPPPLLARHARLQAQETNHKVVGIVKKVHVEAGRVHGLQQWAVATFEPGSATERHHHPTLTEVFHVRSGVATFHFDDDMYVDLRPASDQSEEQQLDSASASASSTVVAHADDTITIPPGVFHVVANRHAEPLVLVYASILM